MNCQTHVVECDRVVAGATTKSKYSLFDAFNSAVTRSVICGSALRVTSYSRRMRSYSLLVSLRIPLCASDVFQILSAYYFGPLLQRLVAAPAVSCSVQAIA